MGSSIPLGFSNTRPEIPASRIDIVFFLPFPLLFLLIAGKEKDLLLF